MSLSDYMDSELRTLFNAIEKHFEIEEQRQRQEWERVRWLAATTVNIQLKRKDRVKVTELLPLPWDSDGGKQVAKPLSYDEQKALFEKLDNYVAQKKAAKNGDRRS